MEHSASPINERSHRQSSGAADACIYRVNELLTCCSATLTILDYVLRFLALVAALSLALNVVAETAASRIWADLKAKRESLPSAHQEFAVSRTYKTASHSQSSKQQLILDMAPGRWRELSISGSGKLVRIFNGEDVLRMEEDGDEFTRAKRTPKDADREPAPYDSINADWSKAADRGAQPCGLPGRSDMCTVIVVPVKPWVRNGGAIKMLNGAARLVLHVDTGLLLSMRTSEFVETKSSSYQSDTIYIIQRMSYGAALDASLFRLPDPKPREVKELSNWNAAKIKKQLAGRAAPELAVTDIHGKSFTLADLKGKVVLLDFWTTWCPPCREDASNLDKLYQKYGEHDLAIVGISVSEERRIVESFLEKHPHSFAIVLTTENDMPRPYQVRAFPTYIVINRDGNVESAVEGDQGFSELRKLLKKAGVEAE